MDVADYEIGVDALSVLEVPVLAVARGVGGVQDDECIAACSLAITDLDVDLSRAGEDINAQNINSD